MPDTESGEFTAYNTGSSKKRKMPNPLADFLIYNNSPKGPSTEELRHATLELVKEKQSSALASKVEAMFMALGWFIIWTPPYCPKFQLIELVWGVAKQRAARLWYKGRTLAMALKHLRFGFYGGVP